MARDEDEAKAEQIEQARIEEQRLTVAAKREAAERKRADNLFAKKALEAKRANDQRAYATLLRLRNVPEGSEEWKNAWKYFFS